MFTLLPVTEINDTIRRHQVGSTASPPVPRYLTYLTQAAPGKRLAQRLLADEITELVHTRKRNQYHCHPSHQTRAIRRGRSPSRTRNDKDSV